MSGDGHDLSFGTGCVGAGTQRGIEWRPPDGRRTVQLALATVWLLDGVLQLQPFMFTAGTKGFSGMLAGTATGNPSWVARTITWNASVVDHHAVATNTAFAFIQIALGFGIAWRRTTKPALAASIVWSVGVWWFGEGLGGVLYGAATPIGGGPGAVLFYALLAVLLWPTDQGDSTVPYVAGRSVGVTAAKSVWVLVWAGLAFLTLVGAGRSPQGIFDVIGKVDAGQPGWLNAVDRHAESLVAHDGLTVALVFAAIFVVVAAAPFLPVAAARVTLLLAVVSAAAIWIVGENFGGILAGGATDPNSGPPLILLVLAYWPLSTRTSEAPSTAADWHRVTLAAEAT